MNAGFRGLAERKDTARFKAYLLAIAVQMLIVPLLQFFGIIQLAAPPFYPAGAILGGFLFGLAMNWGGGCAAGIWYKLGSGSIGAFGAIIGLIIGYVATENGALKMFRHFIQALGNKGNVETMTLGTLFNLPLLWVALPLAGVLLLLLLKNPVKSSETNWKKTGLWVGTVGVIAWLASSFAGRFFGMAVLPGCKDAFDLLAMGKRSALSWDLFFVLGILIGGYLSASRQKQFHWSSISGTAIWKLAGGGFILGVSASLAGGCTVGHGLTGIPLLALGSLTFTIFAILGAWAGLYLQKLIMRKKTA
jgi:hypothetical protein